MSAQQLVLLYSGGLDTSVLLKWFAEKGYDVHAYVCDVGQREDWAELERKAMASGAKTFIADDKKEEFTADYVYPAVAFNAKYEGRYMLGTSLARPVIIKGMVEYCRKVGASVFAHGATGKGNDQVRFELSAAVLAPDLEIIAPWRDEAFRKEFPGRKEMIEYAEKYDIPVKATKKKPWSSDENLLHISFEAGVLEDPGYEPDEDMFELSVSPEAAPDKPTYVEIELEKGVPVAINGEKMKAHDLLAKANEIAGANGVGRVDLVESRFVGMKSRGVYETPGGTLLYEAFRDLETMTVDRGVMSLKDSLMSRFAHLAYNGFWFGEECQLLLDMQETAKQYVTGKVKLKCYKGSVISVGRWAEVSLYDEDVASMEDDHGAYNQDDATGFIHLNGLPLRMSSKAHKAYI
ncbi:MAG: argininosuccinate synthase [Planctomycetes bacterium]|nr:argininosuccinate synthase [Planctomycetota bacterium]